MCAHSGALGRGYYHTKHLWLSFAQPQLWAPLFQPQTKRKSKGDVQRQPQKALEKQNFTLSFAAIAFDVSFSFSPLSLIDSSLF